uniref:hypothetical protein n=1 Tax=uncultured Sphingomonas sp. TaxID=158754 RepID=UPI0035CAADEE
MVAEARRARLRERGIVSAAARRFIAALEPWYNWGTASVERMQGMHLVDGYSVAMAEGEVRFFEIQWLGVHLEIQLGRTPKAVR